MKIGIALLFVMLAARCWSKTPVILSTDVGNEIDDQWAIAYMLLSPSFDVRGIVSAHAPSLPSPSAHSTYEILVDEVERRLGMLSHVPLFEGSSEPLANRQIPRLNAGVEFMIDASKSFSQENRLAVLTIGAATDVASAILQDPSITNRISVVAMGFKSLEGGDEYNVQNDPQAWRVILDSDVPVTIGAADVCRKDLLMSFDQANTLVSKRGPVGAWLWNEYEGWYFRNVKPLRKNDFSKPWVIWDTVVMAYEQGMTMQKEIPRPRLAEDLSLEKTKTKKTITWITGVDSNRLWTDFAQKLDYYQSTHAVDLSPCLLPHL
ncbi:MAG: nucleoside hydrolase [Acidobacteriaceae bacterium]|nr:nucleoside hydrolase [Acidobacteriaceae bacterium]